MGRIGGGCGFEGKDGGRERGGVSREEMEEEKACI